MTNEIITVDSVLAYLRKRLEAPGIIDKIEWYREAHTSKAGTSREGIFNKELLCPAIAALFLEDQRHAVDLSNEQIRSELGAEGSGNVPNFMFTPKLDRDYFFEKGDVLGSSPPEGWVNPDKLRNYRSYADFAIREPLPVSLVGELKYERNAKTRQGALKAIYEVTRQCAFYLGAFGHEYESALALIADATEDHVVYETFEQFPLDLRKRYGCENRIHLLVLRLT